MSAYVVNTKHLDALITWAAAKDEPLIWFTLPNGQGHPVKDNESAAGQLLHDQNVHSVNYFYETDHAPIAYMWTRYPERLSVAQVLKACDCYDYQAGAIDGYKYTWAGLLIDAIRSAAIERMPGYKEAHWEIKE